jgi:hypothetical protein
MVFVVLIHFKSGYVNINVYYQYQFLSSVSSYIKPTHSYIFVINIFYQSAFIIALVRVYKNLIILDAN